MCKGDIYGALFWPRNLLSAMLQNRDQHPRAATVEGRNPFRANFNPWETWYSGESSETRVSFHGYCNRQSGMCVLDTLVNHEASFPAVSAPTGDS